MKKIFKILGMISAVIIFTLLVIICCVRFMNLTDTRNRNCEQGPLAKITDCKYEQSPKSQMNSGWWYSDAMGELDAASCDIVTEGEDELPITEMNGKEAVPITLYKVSCENFGHGIAGVCYASQRMAVNGNSRYVKIVMADKCNKVRYFEGSKYTIQGGKVTEYDWETPIKDIPDEKTGKVEPVQTFG